ncbi:Uncharacterized protein dnl_34210 [Desulfonema limicola]|uniref:Uncharacterized protein n=1 Tax=Desulfonema limicola TaxID=45656 RepID=A0A975B9L5_9BACT|nr:Uncharacterized protein dnl_34210 [Desulfonema limicola]
MFCIAFRNWYFVSIPYRELSFSCSTLILWLFGKDFGVYMRVVYFARIKLGGLIIFFECSWF